MKPRTGHSNIREEKLQRREQPFKRNQSHRQQKEKDRMAHTTAAAGRLVDPPIERRPEGVPGDRLLDD